jgi:hypothetical protein
LKAKKPESASADSGFFLRGSSVRQTPLGKLTAQVTHPCRDKNSWHGDDAGTAPSPTLLRGDVNLTRASDRAMARQWTRPHSEARRKRRRHVVKRSAAITATILWRAFDAQPVAARRTIRIQTLHRPTGQILHSFASQNPRSRRRKGERLPPKRPDLQKRQSWRDCALGALVSQEESIQLVVVLLQTCGKPFQANSCDTTSDVLELAKKKRGSTSWRTG